MKLLTAIAGLLLSVSAFAQTCPPPTQAPKINLSSTTVIVEEGSSLQVTVSVTGSPAPTVTILGTLPSGVSYSSGSINGIPVVGSAGVYPVTVSATNGVIPDAFSQLTITVVQKPVEVGIWTPDVNTSWQWQIGKQPNANQLLSVQMYDIDGFNSSVALVSALHAKGIRAVCYLSVGTWEDWRPDAAQFPAAVKGKSNGWPGEKWLDIRSAALRPIIQSRFQMCKDKGFDAIEPDNIDGYDNSTSFPLKAADQIAFNTFLATTAHDLGLSIALKNDGAQVKQLVGVFDFSIAEECVQYDECGLYSPFVSAGKAVFAAEYKKTNKTCSTLNDLNFNGAIFDKNLTGSRQACR